jgi:hypothetical protein
MKLVAAWILSLQLVYGGTHYTIGMPNEQQCVQTGERLYAGAVRRAKARGLRPPPGWVCVEGDATAQPGEPT